MSNHTEDSTENLRCFKEKAPDGPSLFQGGKLVLQNYHIGWIITGVFTLIACVVSLWLVGKHLRNYTNKHEQRYIVRILFMVPIYALVSFASFLFWNHATLLILVRDCYESTVLTAFFYLLLLYLSPTSEGQRKIFLKSGLSKEADREALRKGETPQKWMFPLGSVKWKPKDGLYFLQLMKWGVLQYCVIRPTTTLAAVILEYLGLYCEESWGLGWGHPYIVIIVSISVSIAMYCLIQLYLPVSVYLAPHRPLLKLFAIKAVVFLTFWQATFLSALSLFGVVKATKYMTAADVNIGIGAILETVEMTIFAFLHIRAFSYKPYVLKSSEIYLTPEHTPLFRSLGHAFDFRETFKEIWHGMRYMGYKFKKQEVPEDIRPRRAQAYGVIFGKERDPSMMPMLPSEKQTEKSGESIDPADEKALPTLPVIDELDHDVDAYDPHERVRDWLGVGKAKHTRRETSDFGVQVERELQRRGLSNNPRSAMPMPDTSQMLHEATPAHHMKHPTWWRRIYSRFSEHNQDPGTRFTGQDGRQGIGEGHYSQVNLDDLPPPSQLLSRRDSRYPSTLRPPVSGLPSPTDDRREDWLYSSFPAPPNIGAGRAGSNAVVDHPAILERPEASRHGQRGGDPEREIRGLYRQKRTERAARVHRRESALYHDS